MTNSNNKQNGKGQKPRRGSFLTMKIMLLLGFALLLFLAFKMGIGGFGGSGPASEGDKQGEQAVTETKPEEEEKITIEVKKDLYLIEGKEVSLEEIKEKVTTSDKKVSVILENNYASAKSWDEIKNALSEWGITTIDQ